MVVIFPLIADLPQPVSSPSLDTATYIGVLLTLVAINAFFVAAEFAIVAVRRSRINQLVEAGSSRALSVQRLQRQIDRFLSTTQLGITLASVALGWLGQDAMVIATMSWLQALPLPSDISTPIAQGLAVPISFLLIVYLQIVLGELVPKSVALLSAEGVALWLGRPSEALADALSPFLWVLNQSTRLLLRIVGVEYTSKSWYSAVSAEELQMIITTSTESSGLEAEERELLKNVFEFGEVTVAEVMVPRTSIQYVEFDATVRQLLEAVSESNHSRYPAAGESLDDIRGIVHIKDIIGKLSDRSFDLDQSINAFIRPVRFVSEDTYLGDLLPQMQRSQQSVVMIVDEFGGTAGLVTLEDIISEIVGNFSEPSSNATPDIRTIDDRNFSIQAQVNLETVNESLGLSLPLTDEYQTLGGFVIYHLQKIPMQGETLVYDDLEMTITATDGPRIECIRLHRLEKQPEPDSAAPAESSTSEP
jgi:CBS domain containing-hemolysin-like protein